MNKNRFQIHPTLTRYFTELRKMPTSKETTETTDAADAGDTSCTEPMTPKQQELLELKRRLRQAETERAATLEYYQTTSATVQTNEQKLAELRGKLQKVQKERKTLETLYQQLDSMLQNFDDLFDGHPDDDGNTPLPPTNEVSRDARTQ